MTLLSEVNVVRLKVGLYAGLFFFFFFVTIAIPVTTEKIGTCFLYIDLSVGQLGSVSNCNYPVAIAVIFQLIYGGLFRLVTLLLLTLGILNGEFVLFSDLFQLIFTVVDCVALFLVLVSACILSAGINTTCNRFQDCDVLFKGVDGSSASRMHVAEAGAWISFILWLVLVVVGVFWLFRQGKIPFISRGPRAGDGGPSGVDTAPSPQMDTPRAAGDPKY